MSSARTTIAALFVARDAVNFGVVETLVSIVLIVGFALAVAAWTLRKKPRAGP